MQYYFAAIAWKNISFVSTMAVISYNTERYAFKELQNLLRVFFYIDFNKIV